MVRAELTPTDTARIWTLTSWLHSSSYL